MPIDLILPISITFAVISWTLIFYWYIHPVLGVHTLVKAVEPILFLHTFRYVGLMFLLPGVTVVALDSRFADPAAYGDLIAAVLAFLAIFAIRLKSNAAVPLIWIFNIWGLLDLLYAVVMGLQYTQDGDLGAAFWIPSTIVPLLVVSHFYVFILLFKHHNRSRISADV